MSTNLNHRVIIDTNLWISFLLTNDYSKIDFLIEKKDLILLFNNELITEFTEVATRPKFKKYFSPFDLEELLLRLSTKSEIINTISTINICRDPKDNYLLSLAQDGNATHLLTGDKALLEIKKIGNTKIIKISEYINLFLSSSKK